MPELKKTVGDYVTLQRGTTYKGVLVGKPGPALLGLGSIEPGGGFREGHFKTYGGECPEKLVLYPGDLYVALKGATKDGSMIGSVARVPNSVQSGRITQDTVKLQFADSCEDKKNYLYWVLRTPEYRNYCAEHATGTAMVALSREDFLSYPVPPPTKTSLMLVSLFERIERKIELNCQMNRTLEEMVAALFKSWFVDFDPVHAKAAGRRPFGMDDETAVLFSDRFVESELGLIPEGWEYKTLGDVTSYLKRGLGPKYIEDGGIRVINQRCIRNSRVTLADARRHDPGKRKIDGRILQKGDVLINSTGVGTLGRAAQLPDFLERLVADSHVSVVRGDPTSIESQYLAIALLTRQHELADLGEGSTGQTELGRKILAELPLICPTLAVQRRFSEIVTPWRDLMFQNEIENGNLGDMRDTFLPKLFSGDIQINNQVERFSEEVV